MDKTERWKQGAGSRELSTVVGVPCPLAPWPARPLVSGSLSARFPLLASRFRRHVAGRAVFRYDKGVTEGIRHAHNHLKACHIGSFIG